jgi:bifunctional non-homologous end joining protein LigD
MIPAQVRQPFHRPGWIYEEKVDGWRILAYKDGGRVRLVSRQGMDHGRRFPELVEAIARLQAPTLVLDGEVAVFDQQLRSRFDLLREPDPAIVATPPVYIAFDLLYQTGKDLTERPLGERRARLEDLVADAEPVFAVRRLAADGLEAWNQVLEREYEGYVVKHETSRYQGGPTRSWLKVKQPGWTLAEDRWQRRIADRPGRGQFGPALPVGLAQGATRRTTTSR